MIIRIHVDESIAIVDDLEDQETLEFESYDNFTDYEIGEGCQTVNCEISKPKQGHNGGCKCFKNIPVKYRGIARQLVEEQSKL